MKASTRYFSMADYGKVLSTRNVAGKIVDHIDRLIADDGWRLFALDFTGVEIVTPSCVDELVKRLEGLRSVEMVLVGMNPDIHEVVALVDEHRCVGGNERVRRQRGT